jgi:hypothetical protein
MSKHYAKLVIGVDYSIGDKIFKKDHKEQIDPELFDYLNGHPQFEVEQLDEDDIQDPEEIDEESDDESEDDPEEEEEVVVKPKRKRNRSRKE